MIIKPDFPFKARTTRHSALTTYQKFSSDQDPPENLTPSEFKVCQKTKNIVIQKADKGNTLMILDKCSYISRMEEILNDNSKFSKLDIPAAGKEIKHIINLEKRI